MNEMGDGKDEVSRLLKVIGGEWRQYVGRRKIEIYKDMWWTRDVAEYDEVFQISGGDDVLARGDEQVLKESKRLSTAEVALGRLRRGTHGIG
ncbi:unnamed protein product [Sphenostylis stenocarpa]|uniref:Uncharacterized protein n=1 Tax=Sphenostylis stenocarpa TaxID=92480 RepID=A0AA86VCT1_9FABA|nr:unnamed protein product [Sphenostylis stenocarpa]